MCFMTLGRGVEIPKVIPENIFNPTIDKNGGKAAADPVTPSPNSKAPTMDHESWRVVFLVPVCELTDRRTVTLHRMVPYEVRNDIRILAEKQRDKFLETVRAKFNDLLNNKWMKTGGYLMHLYREGLYDK